MNKISVVVVAVTACVVAQLNSKKVRRRIARHRQAGLTNVTNGLVDKWNADLNKEGI